MRTEGDKRGEKRGDTRRLGLLFLICYSPVLARASPVWGLRIQTEWWSSTLTPRAAEDWRRREKKQNKSSLRNERKTETQRGGSRIVSLCVRDRQRESDREWSKWGAGSGNGLVEARSSLNPERWPKRLPHRVAPHSTVLITSRGFGVGVPLCFHTSFPHGWTHHMNKHVQAFVDSGLSAQNQGRIPQHVVFLSSFTATERLQRYFWRTTGVPVVFNWSWMHFHVTQ